MQVTIAKNAGFCFGVKRATDRLEGTLESKGENERIYTLGALIHNDSYNKMLYERGVRVTDISEIEELCATASAQSPVTVFVRAHGIPREDEEKLMELSEKNPHFRYEDCTCPFVKKIHNIVRKNCSPDHFLVLSGSGSHPECVGIMSYFDGEKIAIKNAKTLEAKLLEKGNENFRHKTPKMVAQTTQN